MAWLIRLGTRTWRTSPTKEATSEVMKIPLWAPMMGMTRRSQVRDLSGSMVARGGSLRATTSMGTNSVPTSGVVDGRGRSRGDFIGPPSGPDGRPRRRSAMPPGRRRPASDSSGSSRQPAISASRPATAASARSRAWRPLSVRTWSTCRRSETTCRRSTRPRATRPSTMAVTLGGRTARRSARSEETADRSSSRPSTRYWGADRSAVARPISTCLASQAAARPMFR